MKRENVANIFKKNQFRANIFLVLHCSLELTSVLLILYFQSFTHF